MPIESSLVATPYRKFHVEAIGYGKPVLFIHGGTAPTRERRPVLGGDFLRNTLGISEVRRLAHAEREFGIC